MASTPEDAPAFRDVGPEEFLRLSRELPGASIIDVRTEEEYAEVRIPGARLFDIHDPEFSDRITQLDRETPYLVYCRSGNRSSHAMAFMRQIGFRSVYNLDDGMLGWDGPVEEGA